MKVVITGSSHGIGRALTARLLGRGHDVHGLSRSDQSGNTFPGPGRFTHARCDVSEWSQVEACTAQLAAQWGHVDALVTCAAVHGPIGPALSADPRHWAGAVRANLDGTFFALRALAPLLAQASRRAKVVCFSGGGATQARPGFSAYGTAKTGVVRLVETIAAEERSRPLDINAVAPGAIPTRLTQEIVQLGASVVGAAEFAAAQSAADPRTLETALDLVEWLLSHDSDGISGRLISAKWDAWREFAAQRETLTGSDLYTLRRITPADRGPKA